MDAIEHDLEYMAGQIKCLSAMLLGLGQVMAQEDLRALFLDRLEKVRTELLATAVTDVQLFAVDDFEQWLRHETEP